MKQVAVTIKGIAPLLHNRFATEEHGENKKVGKKKIYVPEDEARRKLYIDKETGKLMQPTEHVLGALIKAAAKFIYDKRITYKDIIKAGIIIDPEFVPLNKDKWDEIDTRAVVIQRNRVICWRPRFNDWESSFTIQIVDDENISLSVLKDILERAGKYHGIGDYRPRFGRFMVTSFKEAD